MDLLIILLAIGLLLFLMRKDIFMSYFKLGIKVLGLNIEMKAKEKSCPPAKKDNFNPE